MRREGLLTGYKGMLVDRCEYVMDECGNAWICFVQDSVLSHRCVEVTLKIMVGAGAQCKAEDQLTTKRKTRKGVYIVRHLPSNTSPDDVQTSGSHFQFERYSNALAHSLVQKISWAATHRDSHIRQEVRTRETSDLLEAAAVHAHCEGRGSVGGTPSRESTWPGLRASLDLSMKHLGVCTVKVHRPPTPGMYCSAFFCGETKLDHLGQSNDSCAFLACSLTRFVTSSVVVTQDSQRSTHAIDAILKILLWL